MFEKDRRFAVLALLVLAYFVSYPEDVQAISAPISVFLNLSTAISPWFYGVVAVAIFTSAMVKIWGGSKQFTKSS